MKELEDASLIGKTVIVRIDTDVPLSDDSTAVLDDYRLRQALPTIFYLINHKARIILVGHLGRPLGKTVKSMSLKPVYLHLSALLNKKILFAGDPFNSSAAKVASELEDGQILGLENIRFFKGEEDNSRTFAKKLASLGEIYINDAFGTSHREAASIAAITEFLPSYPGLQLEKEVEILKNLVKHPAHPFIAVVGGAKISDKLPVIKSLLPIVDRVLVGGGVANTFLASQGFDVKQSLIEQNYVEQAGHIFHQAKGKIVLPTDFQWADSKILDIGPLTVKSYQTFIKPAQTVLWSGVVGMVEREPFQKGSLAIAEAIGSIAATSVTGGGDTVAFIEKNNQISKFTFVSTGGSAMLELLGGRVLPGIRALR